MQTEMHKQGDVIRFPQPVTADCMTTRAEPGGVHVRHRTFDAGEYVADVILKGRPSLLLRGRPLRGKSEYYFLVAIN